MHAYALSWISAAAALGILAVLIVDAGVNDVVDAWALSTFQPAEKRLVLHAVAAPISEETVKAMLLAFIVAVFRPGRSSALWASLGLAAGFATTETLSNGDAAGWAGFLATVATRFVGHAVFALPLTLGLMAAVRRRRPDLAVVGVAGAMVAHSIFNALGVVGLWPLRSALFIAALALFGFWVLRPVAQPPPWQAIPEPVDAA